MNDLKAEDRAIHAVRRRRAVVLGLILAGVVLVIYFLSIFKMGANLYNRPL